MKNKIAIVDGNNLLYRTYYKYQNMRSQKGLLTSIIYGFPYVLRSMINEHSPDDLIVVFDGGRDPKRMELYPEYKAGREQKVTFDKEDFYRQRDILLEILNILCIKHVTVKGREADDIIWKITRRLKPDNQIIIISSDKDFKQLISKNVSVWSPKESKRFTHKNLDSELGFPGNRHLDFLILTGDVSDNIKGLVGVGEVRAKHFISNTKSISDYLRNNQEEIKSFERSRLEPVFLLNRQLIDIRLFNRRFLKGVKVEIPETNDKIKLKKLAMICSNHSITTFSKPDFIRVFEKLLSKNKELTIWRRFS